MFRRSGLSQIVTSTSVATPALVPCLSVQSQSRQVQHPYTAFMTEAVRNPATRPLIAKAEARDGAKGRALLIAQMYRGLSTYDMQRLRAAAAKLPTFDGLEEAQSKT